jgi:tRNA pseudouridine38-40 synthase
MRYALLIEFDGLNWAGTATQVGKETLQAELRRVVALLGGEVRLVRLCSRLDAGVAAEGLAAHVEFQRLWKPTRLVQAFNGHLHEDVTVLAAAQVADDWDAIIAATEKTYRYRCLVRDARPALDKRMWHLRTMEHPELLQKCAQAIIGHHDLAAFACRRSDWRDERPDKRRNILSSTWTHESWRGGGTLWTYRVRGDGFLYRQVRGIVGAMVAVARGVTPFQDFLEDIDRGMKLGPDRIGNVAPPQGLCLESVLLSPTPAWESSNVQA